MIRTAELTAYYRYPQERVWEAITGGDTNLKVTPITEEQADAVKPELGKAICQVTELDPPSRCAMRMRGPGFTTDWSAELCPAENENTRVIYRQSVDYAAKRLYIGLDGIERRFASHAEERQIADVVETFADTFPRDCGNKTVIGGIDHLELAV